MLSKKFNENDVKMMFAPFGNIEDCTVLRDQNGQSRGEFNKMQVSMTRKCHNHRPQTNAWHREEETQNTNSQVSARTENKVQ